MGIAYFAGLLPALVTGNIFASLPAAWQRVIVSLVVGATVTWLLSELLGVILRSGPMPRQSQFILFSAGALAAATSAYVARLILELLGRHYDRYGGLGGA